MVVKLANALFFGVLWLIVNPHVMAIETHSTFSPSATLPSVNAPNKKTFTVAFSEHSYPQQFVNQQGQVDGMVYDFWQLWAKKQKVTIEYKPMQWLDTIDAIRSGSVDFHAGMVITPERETYLEFSNGIYPHNNFIYLHKDIGKITSLDQLTPYKVGVVKGSSHISSILGENKQISLQLYETREDMYDAALNHEILAFAELDKINDTYSHLAEVKAIFPKFKRLNYHSSDYSAAVPQTNSQLLAFINEGLAKITITEWAEIERKWLHSPKTSNALNLGFTTNLPPYMGYSASGQAQGLYIDIWRLWSKYSGMEVNFIGDTMARTLQQVKQGSLDAHVAYPDVIDEVDGVQKAAQVYALHSQVFVASRLSNITSLEQLSGKNMGVFKTAPYVDLIKQQYPDINLVYFTGHSQVLAAAERGEIDAAVSEVENMRVQLVNANMQSAFYLLPEPRFPAEMYALVSRKNDALAEFIQQGFDKIPLEELRRLESIWLSHLPDTHYKSLKPQLPLTNEEKQWIRDKKLLKVGITSDWEPLEFVDSSGNPQGINKDIMDTVAEGLGIELSYQAFDNWSALFNAFRREEVDLLLGISTNEARQSLLDFSNVYWQMPWSIIYRRTQAPIKNITDLYGKQVAMVRGYRLVDWMRNTHPSVNISLVDSVPEGVMAVQQGLVDGFIEALPVVSKFAKQESITPLDIAVVPEIPAEESRIGMRKGNEILKSIVNQGLKLVNEQKRQEIFGRWFDVNIQTGWDKRFVTKVAAQIGFVILAIILFVVVWNRKLHQEVTTRKALEQKMKYMATHDELTGLANRNLMKAQMESAIALHQRQELKMAVMFVDLDGFKGINDQHGHDVGDKVLEEVAARLTTCVRKSDTLCRFGGDEFVILLTSLNNKEETAFIAEKIIEAIAKPYQVEGCQAHLGSSIGIAMYPDDGNNESDLLKMADHLMYRVKSSGKNNFMYR